MAYFNRTPEYSSDRSSSPPPSGDKATSIAPATQRVEVMEKLLIPLEFESTVFMLGYTNGVNVHPFVLQPMQF